MKFKAFKHYQAAQLTNCFGRKLLKSTIGLPHYYTNDLLKTKPQESLYANGAVT